MKIVVVGTGYVGLVSGACFSEFGFDVVCVDKDAAKIAQLKRGEMPIYEPGLDDLVKRNVEGGRLRFSGALADEVGGADAVFIAVGTPARRGDGHADLTYVFEAAEEVALCLGGGLGRGLGKGSGEGLDGEDQAGYVVVVTKSTVPVGTGRRVEAKMRAVNGEADFDVVSNPEFLREGSAIADFMRPDRVVVGVESARAAEVMRGLYRPLYLIEKPILFTGLETAELIKYAANAFLAVKISYINQMADLCEKVGADVHDVAKGMGLDQRIGGKFLHAGPGYGGSCFPKDTLALVKTADDFGAPVTLVSEVVAYNDARKKSMAVRVIEACGGDVGGKKIAILGLAFKPETDDMRDSPAIDIVHALVAKGACVQAYDPAAIEEARAVMPDDLVFTEAAEACLRGAVCAVLVTEWNEFRALTPQKFVDLMEEAVIVDLRNVYEPTAMQEAGVNYKCVGRG